MARKKKQGEEREDTVQIIAEVAKKEPAIVFEQLPYKATWTTPQGKKIEKSVVIRTPSVRLRDAQATPVASESIMKLAKGEVLSKKELATDPILEKFTESDAKALILYLCKIGSGLIEEVK